MYELCNEFQKLCNTLAPVSPYVCIIIERAKNRREQSRLMKDTDEEKEYGETFVSRSLTLNFRFKPKRSEIEPRLFPFH